MRKTWQAFVCGCLRRCAKRQEMDRRTDLGLPFGSPQIPAREALAEAPHQASGDVYVVAAEGARRDLSGVEVLAAGRCALFWDTRRSCRQSHTSCPET